MNRKQIVIDFKTAAFPMESLGGHEHAGVKYAPGDQFDAVTQHTRDRLIAKGRAKDASPVQTQAVEVRATSEEVEVQPASAAEPQDAITNAVPEQVDKDHDIEERQSPQGERSGSEAEGSGTEPASSTSGGRFFKRK